MTTELQGSAPEGVGNQWERRYKAVNGEWPSGELPPLTGQEAISAAKRLYRLGMGKAFGGKWRVTSGRRYSYPRWGVFSVNPSRGWHDLVHDISHYCHRRLHPNAPPHALGHSLIEKELIAHVVNSGWLDGRLKLPEKPKTDIREARAARIAARIETWERKRRRAETALKKLRRTQAYYAKMN